jgi:soluble lytic murein transglycosylase-like protein
MAEMQDTASASEIMDYLSSNPTWRSGSPAKKRAEAMRMMRRFQVPDGDINQAMSGLLHYLPQGGLGPKGSEVADMAELDPETTFKQSQYVNENLPSGHTAITTGTLLATAPLGPVGRIAGGVVGEGLSQALGYAPFDPENMLWAGATVAGPELAMRGGSMLLNLGPKRGAATLNRMGEEHALDTIQQYKSGQNPNRMFDEVRQNFQTWRMNMPNMQSEIQRATGTPGQRGQFQYGSGYTQAGHNDAASHLESIMTMLNGIPGRKGGMKVQPSGYPGDIQAELNALRQKALSAEGTELNAYSSALEAAKKDLERFAELERRGAFIDPATGKAVEVGAQKLLDARAAYLRDETVKDISTMIEGAFNPTSGSGSAQRFNSAQVLRNLKKDPFFEKAFTTQEQAEIRGLLEMTNKIPPLQPHGAINAGSKRMMTMAGLAASGAGAGYASGSPLAAVVGGLIGAGLPNTVTAINNALIAWKMPAGKAMLKELAMGNTAPQVTADILANYAGAAMRDANARTFAPPFQQQLEEGYDDTRAMESGPANLDLHLQSAAEQHNVPAPLLKAVMQQESAGNPQAVSQAGAQGLMQLMPGTAQEMGVTDPFDPIQSIDGGARYLGQLLKQFNGSIPLALAAYNAGPRKVREAGNQIPNIRETQEYVRKVSRMYRKLQGSEEN